MNEWINKQTLEEMFIVLRHTDANSSVGVYHFELTCLKLN